MWNEIEILRNRNFQINNQLYFNYSEVYRTLQNLSEMILTNVTTFAVLKILQNECRFHGKLLFLNKCWSKQNYEERLMWPNPCFNWTLLFCFNTNFVVFKREIYGALFKWYLHEKKTLNTLAFYLSHFCFLISSLHHFNIQYFKFSLL